MHDSPSGKPRPGYGCKESLGARLLVAQGRMRVAATRAEACSGYYSQRCKSYIKESRADEREDGNQKKH
jgi:hypothetical protein